MICSIYLCVFFIVTDIIWIHGSMQGSFVIPWFSGWQLHSKYPTEETNSNGISTTFYVSTFIIFPCPTYQVSTPVYLVNILRNGQNNQESIFL